MITLSGTPVLTTARLTLRAPQASDWPTWRNFTLSERAQFVRPAEYDVAKAWRAFGHVIGMWVMRGYGSFVFSETGSDTPLGLTGPWHPEGWPEPEIGWTVWADGAEGKGYAFEAASAARDFAFRDLGWDTAVSYISTGNLRSIRLAERLGAVRDPDAAVPEFDDEVLVYRHPNDTDRRTA